MINKRLLKDCIKMLYQHAEEELVNHGQLAFYRWSKVAIALDELLTEDNQHASEK
jgi:hypothetical protein